MPVGLVRAFPVDVVQPPFGHDHELVETFRLSNLDEPFHVRPQVRRDEADLTDVCDIDRQLLYVACARDWLPLCAIQSGSEFLDDLEARNPR